MFGVSLHIFCKRSIFGRNLTFWPPPGPGQEFSRTSDICALKALIIFWLHAKKFKILRCRSGDIPKRVHFRQKFDLLTPQGACTRVFLNMTHTCLEAPLVSNFMQKIKKFWRLIPKIVLKMFIFGPNLTFWTPWQVVKRVFPNMTHICLQALYYCPTSCK